MNPRDLLEGMAGRLWGSLALMGLLVTAVACGDTEHAGPGVDASVHVIDLSKSTPLRIIDSSVAVEVEESVAGAPLSAVPSGRLLPGGGIALADRLNDRVVVLRESDLEPMVIGRSGQGPGEFLSVDWVGTGSGEVDDAVVLQVWDARAARLTLIDPHGEVLSTIGLDPSRTAQRQQPFLGVFRSGDIPLVDRTLGPPAFPEAEIFRDSFFVSLYAPEGRWLGHIHEGLGDERYGRTDGGSRLVVGAPLGGQVLPAFSSERVWLLDTATGQVLRLTHDGTSEIWWLRGESSPPPREAHRTQWIERLVSDRPAGPAPVIEGFRELWENAPLPERLPVASNWVGSSVGVWVAEYPGLEDATFRWHAIDPDGELLGYFELGPTESVLDADMERILVRRLDELGRAEVWLYRWEVR